MDKPALRKVDTTEYLSMLRGLVEEGRTVSLLVSGSSMSPFLSESRIGSLKGATSYFTRGLPDNS